MTDDPTPEQLADLATRAAALPRDVAPPAPETLLADIHAAIAARSATPVRRTRWTMPALIAAGVTIAVASSALTLAVVRSRGGDARSVASAAAVADERALPVVLASAERGYSENVRTLLASFEGRRARLAPSTIEIVERSLRVSDSAIAEARAALARDPGNKSLAALFSANYERKIDLLRRAAELE